MEFSSGIMQKSLIIGIDQEEGRSLSKFLDLEGHEVIGIPFDKENEAINCNSNEVDILDSPSVNTFLKKNSINNIFILENQLQTKRSFLKPEEVSNSSAFVTLRILNAIVKNNLQNKVKVLQTFKPEFSTYSENQKQLTYSSPFHPRSPHGVSKLYSYWIARNYRDVHKVHASNGIYINQEFSGHSIIKKIAHYSNEKKILELPSPESLYDLGSSNEYLNIMLKTLSRKESLDFTLDTNKIIDLGSLTQEIFFQKKQTIDWQLNNNGEVEAGLCNTKKEKVIIFNKDLNSFSKKRYKLINKKENIIKVSQDNLRSIISKVLK